MQREQDKAGDGGAAAKDRAGESPAKAGSPKAGSRLSNKSPGLKKGTGQRATEESPARTNDSKKNLVSRSKQRKQGESGRNPRESQDGAEEKGKSAAAEEPKSPEKLKKKRTNAAAQPAKTTGPLSQDFSSFDILWFDIETKMRDLVQDLCQPLVDKVHDSKDQVLQLRKSVEGQRAELDVLNQTVFEKGKKLDVFEQIHDRITNVEAERKRIESKLLSDAETIMRTFENQLFEKQQVDQELKMAITKMHEQSEQLTDFVDVTRAQIGDIMERIRVESSQRTAADDELNTRLSGLQKEHNAVQDMADAQRVALKGLSGQVDNCQVRIASLELATAQLADAKCENAEFIENMRRLDEQMAVFDTRVSETRNLCLKLDMYLYKYLPVRTQSVVGDTLRACLTGVERRRHELYDNDKIALLYQMILEDDGETGTSQIEREIIHLNEQAKYVIDEEEKKKRRKTQAADESGTAGPESQAADPTKGSVSKGSIGTSNVHRDTSGRLPEASQDDRKVGSKRISQASLSKGGTHASAARTDPKGGPAPGGLMEDHEVYQLTDLINGDFHMPGSDKDYKLGHEQLIKICKILLHKVNYNQLRNAQDYQLVLTQMKADLQQSEHSMRSSMEEVNQFLQNVHSDFEKFLKRHAREHNEVNLKIQKLSDVAHKTLDNLDQIKEPVENYATFLTCLLEFTQIEQALTVSSGAMADPGLGSPKVALGGNLARLQAGSVSQEGSTSARRAGDTGSYKSLPRGASSGSAAQGTKAGKQKQDGAHSFFPTYKTIENNVLALDEPINMAKDGGQGMGQGKDGARSKTLAGSVALLSPGAMASSAKVNYRKSLLTRSQLVEMRQTLLDKCEEIVAASDWPFGQFNLSTEKIFHDLLQYHAGESEALNNSLGFRQVASLSQDGESLLGGTYRGYGKQTSPGAIGRKVSNASRSKGAVGQRDGSTIGGPKSSILTGATQMSSQHAGGHPRGLPQRGMNATQVVAFHNAKKSVAFNPSYYGPYPGINGMMRGTPATQGPVAPTLSQKSGSVYQEAHTFGGNPNQQSATHHMGWLHSNHSASIPSQTLTAAAVANGPDFAHIAGSNTSIKYVNTGAASHTNNQRFISPDKHMQYHQMNPAAVLSSGQPTSPQHFQAQGANSAGGAIGGPGQMDLANAGPHEASKNLKLPHIS